MRKLPVGKRSYLLVMGTQSITEPNDGFSLFTRVHVLTINNLMRKVRAEIVGIGTLFKNEMANASRSLEIKNTPWTMYRLNILKDYGLPLLGAKGRIHSKRQVDSNNRPCPISSVAA